MAGSYRPPGSRKQYHPLKVLRAIFGRAASPKPRRGGGGRKRKPRLRYRPRNPRPKR